MKNKWTIIVFLITFILALLFSSLSNILGSLNNYFLIMATLLVIIIGILFDTIGTASLSCDIKSLHSKASQKIKGSKEAVMLAKNATKVSSICNDVVGDICGIVSGSLVTILIANLFVNKDLSIYNIIITSVLSSLTVGGKALGKTYAVKKSNDIIYRVGRLISNFNRKK